MKKICALVLLLCLTLLPLASAQDGQDAPEASSSPAVLVAALAGLEGMEFGMTGSVAHKSLGEEGGDFGQVVIIGDGAEDPGKGFSGEIEVWRTKKKELFLTSREVLPGFGFFDDGNRVITLLSFEKGGLNSSDVTADLSGLLNFTRLLKAVKEGDFKEVVGGEGCVTFRGKLAKKLVSEEEASPYAMMAPQVLRVEAEIVMNAEKAIEVLKFTIARTDPFADMRRQALEGDLEGGAEITMEMPQVSQEEGKHTIYTLRPAKEGCSKRIRNLQKQVKWILENQEF